MREDELREAWVKAKDGLKAADDNFIVARSLLMEARSREQAAWSAFISHMERPAQETSVAPKPPTVAWPVMDQFDCLKCANGQMLGYMLVCPTCGNKRCPKASDHERDRTNSNEPGQPGSVY